MAARFPWWRAFTPRKTPSSTTQEESVDDQPVGEKVSSAAQRTDSQVKGTFHKDVYEDAEFEPMFNEQTCRRNLHISRSGRFKEKRRVRATIPESTNFSEGNIAVAVVAK